MVLGIARKLFGSANDRIIKNIRSQVAEINALESTIKALSDDELRGQTAKLRERLKKGETLDNILPEAFATVREASVRVLGMRHFDVQMIGGIILHRGMISEMKTGEGKTLVCTLPAYLNALSSKGVHVVTVNDYLAHRDAEWMGKIYGFLGLSVGCIVHDLGDYERREAYSADITYGTNNEFGFDYLRDNMKYSTQEMVQRPFNYAIVDEVDSILVDEARTPLIISGPTEDNSELYVKVDKLVSQLDSVHYEKEEKTRTVTMTEDGSNHVEGLLKKAGIIAEESGLYDIENVPVVHHVNQALRAHNLFARDVDYIVKDDKVILIDEFTGRMMDGRRFSDGLHQALEAKEKVHIQNENQTLASITFQNYFRLYPKLAGMTGTALTEAAEFQDIYKLMVVEVPTHQPVTRIDHDDEIYRTAREKYQAVITTIEDCHKRGQPVLVGTVSIEKSEFLSDLLKKRKIPHTVLNARYHEKEASIVAQAGRFGAVTIATNMAGRGTDIKLGGNLEMRLAETPNADEKKIAAEIETEKEKVLAAGGLYVIATERHESRRIDNQLRGRSGRQGDPGASKFFLSLEDDLMRIFGSDKMDVIMQKMGMQEGEAIAHPWMSKALAKAQQRVEQRNYEIRKNLLKFDDVMNDQRKVFYEQRRELLESDDLGDVAAGMREEVIGEMVAACIPPKSYHESWDVERLSKEVFRLFNLHLPVAEWAAEEGIADQEILARISAAVEEKMQHKNSQHTPQIMRMAEKRILLHTLDSLWKEHLHILDGLRNGIHLRGYGQRDPLNEYKQEAFALFEHMLSQLREQVTSRLAWLEIRVESPEQLAEMPAAFNRGNFQESRTDPAEAQPETARVMPIKNRKANPSDPESWGRTKRNDPCPCGSGKKYKHCHGSLS